MAVVIDHPLISNMDIRRVLPVHESSRRLRALFPQYPLVYGVAVLDDVARYRWWPIDSERTADVVEAMFAAAAADIGPQAAARQVAATLVHEIIGRMLPLVFLEGRAWDVGLENLWMHLNRDGAIDWVAVVDPTLRVLPDDPGITNGVARPSRQDALVALPSESALTTWVAHRCHRSLMRLFDTLYVICDGAFSVTAMWHIVGSATIGIAAQIPASSDDLIARRSQAILDALVRFGLPVRRTRCAAMPLGLSSTDSC